MKKYYLIAILVLLLALICSVRSCRKNRQERTRLSDNQRALMSDVEYYKTESGKNAAGVERLTLSGREFSRYCKELEKMVSDLNIKVKRLQSAGQTATKTEYVVNTVLRDSIVPGRTDTLRCMDYRDDYLTFAGCISGDGFTGKVESRDTIVQVVHRVPRRFWFIRYGCKAIRQEVVCRNPHSRIVYSEYIELKK